MIPVWPDDLPDAFDRQGLARGEADLLLASESDSGFNIGRQRFVRAVQPLLASLTVSIDGRERFSRFFRDELGHGRLPFLIPAVGIDGAALASADGAALLLDDGSPLTISQWWLVRFPPSGEKPVYEAVSGPVWRIRLSLEVLP